MFTGTETSSEYPSEAFPDERAGVGAEREAAINSSVEFLEDFGFSGDTIAGEWTPAEESVSSEAGFDTVFEGPIKSGSLETPTISVTYPRDVEGSTSRGHIECFTNSNLRGLEIDTFEGEVTSLALSMWESEDASTSVAIGVTKMDDVLNFRLSLQDKDSGLTYDKRFESANPVEDMLADEGFPGMSSVRSALKGLFADETPYMKMLEDLGKHGKDVDLAPIARDIAEEAI